MRNIDYINKKVSEDLNLPKNIIEQINDFYWTTVKKELRNLDNEFIHIKKIGNFEVSKTRLEKQIVTIRRFIYNMRRSHKYTDSRKEEIINHYKKEYKRCLEMRKEVDKTLKFRNSYNAE